MEFSGRLNDQGVTVLFTVLFCESFEYKRAASLQQNKM